MLLLFILTFLDLVGFGIIMPMLPVLAHNYELSTLEIGILVSSFFFAQFFGAIINGYLSDIWGRKPILVFCLIGLVISYILNGFIQQLNNSFYMLVICRLLIGYFSGNIAIIFASVYNISTKDNLLKNMSYLGAAFSLGFIFGPTIGGYLSRDYNSITPFYITAIFYTICLILVIFLFKNPIIRATSAKQNILHSLLNIFKTPSVWFPLSLYVFFAFSFAGLEVFLLTQTLGLKMGLPPFTIGIVWAYFATVITIVQLLLTRFIPKNIAITGGLALFGLSLLSLIFADNLVILCIVLLAVALSLGILFPNINAEISLSGNEQQKGLLFGLNFAAESVGGSLGPYVLSFIYQITEVINSVWVFLGIASLSVSILSIKLLNKTPSPKV